MTDPIEMIEAQKRRESAWVEEIDPGFGSAAPTAPSRGGAIDLAA